MMSLATCASHFTGKERDTESGNDYFGARYYASSMGRFMSPDPINLTNARLLNPANTLNKYTYGANNPLKFVDKDGKDITIFYEAPKNLLETGHIALAAVNQDTGASAFLSFGPANSVSKGAAITGTPGTYDFAFDPKSSSSLTIRTNPEEAQKIIEAINQMESGKAPDFSLLSDNCTTEVEDALRDLGLDFGDTAPSTYWRDVYSTNSAAVQNNPFQAFLPIPHNPGQEYGTPRNIGMNYQNFLYQLWSNRLLVQQPKACVTIQTPNGPSTSCD